MEQNRAKILKRLIKDGWLLSRHGSAHDIYRHPAKPGIITLPRHRKISPGVYKTIARAAEWL